MLHHTPLFDTHAALGATLVDFGGWEMPLWYPSGAVKEHLAVIQSAGLFDISHMSGILVKGPDALPLLQWAYTRDLAPGGKLSPGRACYGAFLDAQGGVVDDAIVSTLHSAEGEDLRFFVVLNAGLAPVVAAKLRVEAERFNWNAQVRELAGSYAKLDIQGPEAARILATILADPDAALTKLGYFGFRGDIEFDRSTVTLKDGTPLLLSRTGYTGEQGFEIFMPEAKVQSVWDQLLKAGNGALIPCGLAARDSLRTGAVLPLARQDIGAWPFINTPWSAFTLPFAPDGSWSKDFLGRSALNAASARHTLPFCGFDPRKVTTGDDHVHPRVLLDGRDIGDVLTCVADVAIGRVDGRVLSLASPDKPEGFAPRGLICGFLRVDQNLPAGTRVTLADARRKVEVEIVTDIRPDRTARKPLRW